VWTLTVEEFYGTSRRQRLAYRLTRHPLLMLTFGPFLIFAIQHRFPSRSSRRKERKSIALTNLALGAIVAGVILAFGWQTYLAIHVPIILFSGAMGIWLFYVQHQFEHTYWRRDGECDFLAAALDGSSFYALPRLLQWFSGNIGFHHVHHLNSRIPNYNLEKCHRAFAALRGVRPLTVRDSLKSARLRLWDERQQRLVGWRDAAPSRG
jgi:omega-6 fatty acid desaturase (delta-12 desaturase)